MDIYADCHFFEPRHLVKLNSIIDVRYEDRQNISKINNYL
ncbi:hypothetical protein pb186bvf_015294 [Paramecium bursaria]